MRQARSHSHHATYMVELTVLTEMTVYSARDRPVKQVSSQECVILAEASEVNCCASCVPLASRYKLL